MSRNRLMVSVSLLLVVVALLWLERVWIWNRLPEFRPGTLEIRDIVGLFVAGLALYLSWHAIRMGRRQEAMMVEQGKVVDKQLEMMTLEVETGKRIEAIAKRQGEITEAQHQIMLEHRAKKPQLRIDVVESESSGKTHRFQIGLFNDGDKACVGASWYITVPDPEWAGFPVEYKILPGSNEFPETMEFVDEGGGYNFRNGFCSLPVFAGRAVRFCELTITYDIYDPQYRSPVFPITCHWYAETDEGRFPEHVGTFELRVSTTPHWP